MLITRRFTSGDLEIRDPATGAPIPESNGWEQAYAPRSP